MLPLTFQTIHSPYLKRWQSQIDQQIYFRDKVDTARNLWPQKSRTLAIQKIRQELKSVSGVMERCHYCGGAEAHQIEHFRPKAIYPEHTFNWDNMLLACDKCNTSKGERFAICQGSRVLEVVAPSDSNICWQAFPTQPGLLNPRTEDPLMFLHLDLETGVIQPSKPLGSLDYERAKYTIEALKLTNRMALNEARKQALRDYGRLIKEYLCAKQSHISQGIHYQSELQQMTYPVVWAEMKRQHTFHPQLQAIFSQAPEILTW